jgi:putative SOS response-associated peptidase YedK
MCGRFGISFDREQIEQRFSAKFSVATFQPRYNAAPTQSLPAILNTDPQTIQFIVWGLKPAWMTKVRKREGIINVRVETLRDRQTFKRDFVERRCLVLADSFYEWRKEKQLRTPFRIALKSGEPFAFAGIWEENHDEDGQLLKTFAILTTEANSLVAQVHNRMPVILRQEDEKRWLYPDCTQEKLLSMLHPYSEKLMTMYEVSRRVNQTTEDTPDLIKPTDEIGK